MLYGQNVYSITKQIVFFEIYNSFPNILVLLGWTITSVPLFLKIYVKYLSTTKVKIK